MLSRVFVVFLCIFAVCGSGNERVLSRQKRKLVFPQFTVLQASMALVSQISFIPSHRVSVNTGFTISYGLPYNSSNFWSPVYWARSLLTSDKASLLSSYFKKLSESGDNFSLISSDDLDESTTPLADAENDETTVEIDTTTVEEQDSERKKSITKRDITASELYSGINEIMALSGYHEDCLLKCVCELAKHPLAASTDDSLVYDVLHFILTPSLHNGFDPDTEREEQKRFEAAEESGKSGGDCDLLYDACSLSPLHVISNYIEVEENEDE